MKYMDTESGGLGFVPLYRYEQDLSRYYVKELGGMIPIPDPVTLEAYSNENPLLFYTFDSHTSLGAYSNKIISPLRTEYAVSVGTYNTDNGINPVDFGGASTYFTTTYNIDNVGILDYKTLDSDQYTLFATYDSIDGYCLRYLPRADYYWSDDYGEQENYPLHLDELLTGYYAHKRDQSFPVKKSYHFTSAVMNVRKYKAGQYEPLDDSDVEDVPNPTNPDSPTGSDEGDTPFPPDPSLSAVGTGFVSLYKTNTEKLSQLSGYLWSDNFLKNIGKIWSDPMDLIITCNIVPYNPTSVGLKDVHIGSLDTEVVMEYLASEYANVNCGTVTIDTKYDNFLDYNNTKVHLFVPFVGIVPLDTTQVMGSTLEIRYKMNMLTGASVVFVMVKKNNMNAILYKYSCNTIYPIQITAKNFTSVYTGALSMVGGIGSAIASGGGAGVPIGLGQTFNGLMNAKPQYQRSGTISGGSAMLDYRTPYVIIERPEVSIPDNFSKFKARPSNIKATLKDLRGYTIVDKVITDNLTCHSDEKTRIINLLTSGVYL